MSPRGESGSIHWYKHKAAARIAGLCLATASATLLLRGFSVQYSKW